MTFHHGGALLVFTPHCPLLEWSATSPVSRREEPRITCFSMTIHKHQNTILLYMVYSGCVRIAIVNTKGGVGKTTTTIYLATAAVKKCSVEL